jgi:hypothetical protein
MVHYDVLRRDGDLVDGYVKLYRKLLDNPVFTNPNLLKTLIWCLLKATYKPRGVLIGLRTVSLQPGQFIFGRHKAAEELRMKPSTLNDYMQALKVLQIIDIKSNNKYSVITLVNWELYQSEDEVSDIKTDIKSDSKATTKQQQTDINNKDNKNKKVRRKEDICATSAQKIKFIPPTFEQVQEYCRERNNSVDPQRWFDHYTSNGWMVGRTRMKDWKAGVRTWEHGNKQIQTGQQQIKSSNPFLNLLKEEGHI